MSTFDKRAYENIKQKSYIACDIPCTKVEPRPYQQQKKLPSHGTKLECALLKLSNKQNSNYHVMMNRDIKFHLY